MAESGEGMWGRRCGGVAFGGVAVATALVGRRAGSDISISMRRMGESSGWTLTLLLLLLLLLLLVKFSFRVHGICFWIWIGRRFHSRARGFNVSVNSNSAGLLVFFQLLVLLLMRNSR